jgi:uncharacterized protein with PIN domain
MRTDGTPRRGLFGDGRCYAMAAVSGLALLCPGTGFSLTDIR